MKARLPLSMTLAIVVSPLAFLLGCPVAPWCPDNGCLVEVEPCPPKERCIPDSVLFDGPDGGHS